MCCGPRVVWAPDSRLQPPLSSSQFLWFVEMTVDELSSMLVLLSVLSSNFPSTCSHHSHHHVCLITLARHVSSLPEAPSTAAPAVFSLSPFLVCFDVLMFPMFCVLHHVSLCILFVLLCYVVLPSIFLPMVFSGIPSSDWSFCPLLEIN